MKTKFYTLLFTLFFSFTTFAQILYVTQNGAGTKDGTSWANAYGEAEFRPNLATAASGTEFWVATGTYKPGATRTVSFVIPGNVSVYGGFAGTETARTERDPAANITTLSGDIGTAGTATDNSYHVVRINATNVTLDGFVVTAGYADGTFPFSSGGGIYVSQGPTTLANLGITNNNSLGEGGGGGIYMDGGTSTISNSVFSGNRSLGFGGGGIYITDGNLTVSNSVFSSNIAPNGGGGGMLSNNVGSVTVSNSGFTSNSATFGGGIYVSRGTTNVTACTFTFNTAFLNGGGGICNISTVNISGSRFITNAAGRGGGLWNTLGGGATGTATVTTSVFDGNSVSSTGGGVSNNGNMTMSKCFLFRNLAQSFNGGTGGGFHQALNNDAISTFTNCVIANNAANRTNDRGGGGVSTFTGTVNLTNCTLSENTTTSTTNPGNGISIINEGTPPVVNLRNTIVWGAATRQVSNSGGTINYTTSLAKGETTNCPNVKTSDPLFIDALDPDGPDDVFGNSNDGLMIQPNSPAKNAGTTLIPPTDDVTGTPRPQGTPGPQGSAYDIGAYETTAGGTGVYEINVRGNNTSIVDGDNNPSTTDSTVFDTTAMNQSSTRTYTIQNLGTDNLTINDISITGTDAASFVAGALTPTGPIAPNGSATFTVTFTRTSAGVKTATINIANSDCDESLYDFAIGTVSPAPIITSNGGRDSAAISIQENTAFVTMVQATDPNTNISPAYSITGGTDRTKFTISSTTGELRFITAPDFEAPTDADGNNTYIVNVRAQNQAGLSDDQLIIVTVTNVNDNPPVITSDGGGATASRSIPENSTAVTTVTATDTDGNTTIKYSKSGGVDSAKFTIDSLSGVLRFITAPDFENPTDADRNNTYIVVVRASDGTLNDEQTITVTVTDVAETPLPVNLVNVKAYQKTTGAIQVEWTTITESNTDRFEVEKSTDGQNFAPIGSVQARGNSNSQLNYNFVDNAAATGSNYYRIKSVDKDGSVQYSNVVRVNVGKSSGAITVYPNPVINNTISLQFSNLKTGRYTVTLTNKLGQQLYRSVIEHAGGSSTQTLRINNSFPKGSYQLQVIGEDVQVTKQLIKN